MGTSCMLVVVIGWPDGRVPGILTVVSQVPSAPTFALPSASPIGLGRPMRMVTILPGGKCEPVICTAVPAPPERGDIVRVGPVSGAFVGSGVAVGSTGAVVGVSEGTEVAVGSVVGSKVGSVVGSVVSVAGGSTAVSVGLGSVA